MTAAVKKLKSDDEKFSRKNTSQTSEKSKKSKTMTSSSITPKYRVCKFLRQKERQEIERVASELSFSGDENAKVEAMKQYFKQYWLSLTYHYKSRYMRLKQLEKDLEKGVSEEERERVLSEHYANESKMLRTRRNRMTTKDFMLLSVLGRGGFGEVYLARKCDTAEILALKKMPKQNFLQHNDLTKLKREKDVMVQNTSPWLIDLKYSFQSETHIYLAMEFIPGGDMKNLLDHVGCFSEDHVRFYTAEMLLAVEALHKLGYIHRDLKPDNFLVDKKGHLKLIDFGLSKDLAQQYSSTFTLKIHSTKVLHAEPHKTNTKGTRTRKNRKTFSVVGSPEYMAIEILEEVGYNHTVDYWSLGIILYELFWGVTPFGGDSIDETFQKLTCWKEYVSPPEPLSDEEEEVSAEAWDIIQRLICEPEKRLGCGDINEIKNHPFFEGFDWDHIVDLEPPFVPELDDELDTSYFANALDEDDIKALSLTAREILNAETQGFNQILLDVIDKDHSDKTLATYYKNNFDKMAFAGWTFKHDDLNILLEKVNDKTTDIDEKSNEDDDSEN
jgi:serine/threonine protein kinase